MDKQTLTVTARETISEAAARAALPAGWIGKWSGSTITFIDGSVLTVNIGCRSWPGVEIVRATDNGDTVTITFA